MKCINKKRKPLSKKAEARRKKVRRTWIAIGALSLLFAAGICSLFWFAKSRGLKEPFLYDRSSRTFGSQAGEASVTARGMAELLCAGPSDTALEGVEGREGELAGLFDMTNKEIPYAASMYEKTSPYGLTQLMTALVAYENLDSETSVTIEPEDSVFGSGVTSCGLREGDVLSVRQLLNAVLVYSADDACKALARASLGSERAFIEAMNAKAQELGMTNTNYVNTTGYTDKDQYTTVYDTYLLFHALLEYPDLTNSMGLSSYTMNYTRASQEKAQQWLDSNNLYVLGRAEIPKDVTVLGGKMSAGNTVNYAALLTQNKYGDVYAVLMLKAGSQMDLYQRMTQMMKNINS